MIEQSLDIKALFICDLNVFREVDAGISLSSLEDLLLKHTVIVGQILLVSRVLIWVLGLRLWLTVTLICILVLSLSA